jgi:predicted DsbA family dithiol-disulfide isomerase
MKIDFVSDVSCPWCAVGLKALEAAIARVGDAIQVDWHFQPFELNPQMAAEGEDLAEHIRRKYGSTPAQFEQAQDALRERGAAVGFEFRNALRRRIYNTFDAHRLLHWAGLVGRQRELKHALLSAYFSAGRNPSDRQVLVDVAVSVGLDGAEADRVLSGGLYADEVRERERFYRGAGIQAVPSVIIDDRHLIQGGQPVEVFESTLRQIAAQPVGA